MTSTDFLEMKQELTIAMEALATRRAEALAKAEERLLHNYDAWSAKRLVS
jgi:hypothetical protein